MKNKLFKTLMLSTLISTVGVGSVFAGTTDKEYETQSTNVSDYSVKMTIENKQNVMATANLEVTGLKTSAINDYFVKFVEKDYNSSGELTFGDAFSKNNTVTDSPFLLSTTKDGKIMSTMDDMLYLNKRDYYAYIYNCTKSKDSQRYCKTTTSTPIKVEKEAMPKLTERYQIYFFGQSTTIGHPYATVFTLYPGYSAKFYPYKYNLKVGIIEDSSVIRAMAKNESGAVEKLYEYAKNATNGTTFTHEIGANNREIDVSSLPVQNGKYYYLYTTIVDEKNELMDLSDVAIVMAKNNLLVNDVDYGEYSDIQYEQKDYEYACYSCTNEYVWTAKGYQAKTCTLVDSITEKSKCVKNAKTGVEDYILPGFLVLIVGGSFVALLNKKSHFKKI